MAESTGPEADRPEPSVDPPAANEPERPSPARRGARGYLAVLIALTLAAVVLVGFGTVFGLRMMEHDAEQARRNTMVRTAGDVALKLTTIDHRNADRDLQQLRGVATPQFAEQFGIRSHAFADTLQQSQIVSTGQVTSAGLEEFDERSARVLVAVRATVRDGGAPRGDPRNYRLGVDLVRQDDKWLVSNVEFIL